MATIASERPASRLRAAPRDWNLLGVVALGAMLVIAAIWLMYETRGTTLWFDEWQWALEYRDNTLHGFIAPHNGHPTLVPVAIYRLLFATVGIDRSAHTARSGSPVTCSSSPCSTGTHCAAWASRRRCSQPA